MKKFMNYIKNNKVVCGIGVALGLSLFFNWATFITISSDITEIENLETNYNELKNEYNDLKLKKEELEKENYSLEKKVEQAKPWFEMKEEERKAEEERLAKEKAEREEKERLAREEQERKEKEEQERKEKQGYETGITYSQLARTPDEYKGEKVKFSGKVLQVSEGLYSDVIRLGVNGSYDNVLWLQVPSGITEERILEDDYITIYGVSQGIHTYTTVMGASMSIPSVNVDKISR